MNSIEKRILQQLPTVMGKKPLWRLRWRFVFADKADKVGVWNGATNVQSDMAAFINKTNLSFALIEGEIQHTGRRKLFVEIPGQIYAHCQWIAAISAPWALNSINADGIKKRPGIIGLSMTTNEMKYSVFVDGSISQRRLSEHDKKFNFTEHKLGAGYGNSK
jgi:hypothetical protein